MSAKKDAKKSQDTVTRNIVIGTVAFVLIFVGGGIALSKQTESKISQAIPSAVDESNGYGITFNKGLAGVPKIDIYEDFQCPYCKQFEAANLKYIDSLINEKKAVVTYHILSFIGPESVAAANASACAADENQFLSFHGTMYANQPAAENSGEWSKERILGIAEAAGITSTSFADCVNNGEYLGWAQKVAEAASASKVNSTPTVLLNGKDLKDVINIYNAAQFRSAVEG
jgi:protein-disulfide isomerase